ncbi:hypothetical protein Q1695_001780 [Nippostrongylus brasiliensis]|nr:hypothetical protein Q1695_001780 [Nippostrongylus brasiliensis]
MDGDERQDGEKTGKSVLEEPKAKLDKSQHSPKSSRKQPSVMQSCIMALEPPSRKKKTSRKGGEDSQRESRKRRSRRSSAAHGSCETQVEMESARKKRTKKSSVANGVCDTQTEMESGRQRRKKREDKSDKTAMALPENTQVEKDDIRQKGMTFVAEMRSKRSARRRKTNREGTIAGVAAEQEKTMVGEKTIRKKLAEDVKEDKKEAPSIRERIKRGIKSALGAVRRSSVEKSYQSAKAKADYVPAKKKLYDYQDSYLGGENEDDDDDEEWDEDMEALTDARHRGDLVLIISNNTNNGRLFNEKGRPFWKDKKFRSEIPKNERKPLSSLLFLLADKQLALKESVPTPTNMDALREDLETMQNRDELHFNEELVISNTVRSIVGTLDGLEEYAHTVQPQKIHKLDVVEPRTAINYYRYIVHEKMKRSRMSIPDWGTSSDPELSKRNRRKKSRAREKRNHKDTGSAEVEERSQRRKREKRKHR